MRTARAGDARRAAREFTGGAILSFGGDGTFNEVLNGADLDRCILGVIPAGAGNVLAKEIGLPLDPLAAFRLLAEGMVARFDLGLCNARRFICMFGAGFDAHVVRVIHQSRRGHLTQLHYFPVIARQFLRPLRWQISAMVDGEPFASEVNLFCVGNTHSYGGPVEMTPVACPTDGAFDVMAARIRTIDEMCEATVAALLRGLHLCGGVRYARGRRVQVSSPRKDVPWEVDGDFGGFLPAEIRCEPGRVRLITPTSFRPRRRVL